MKNKVIIEGNLHIIKEALIVIKQQVDGMNMVIKEIEKKLDENKDESIDKIMFEDMYKKLDKGMEVLYNDILGGESDDHEARIKAMGYIWDLNQDLKDMEKEK